jgi:hypothetical protein
VSALHNQERIDCNENDGRDARRLQTPLFLMADG